MSMSDESNIIVSNLKEVSEESNNNLLMPNDSMLLIWQGLLYNHEDSIEYEKIPKFSLNHKENPIGSKGISNEK